MQTAHLMEFPDIASETARALEQIKSAQTSYDIFKTFKSYIPAFRLDIFGVFINEGSTSLEERVVLANWDGEVIQRCMLADYYDWPFVVDLRSSVIPRSVVLKDYMHANPASDYRELEEFLLGRGFNAFVHLPMRSSNGRIGAIAFSGERELVEMREVMNLDFVARHAYEKLMAIISDVDSDQNPLNEREIECLKAAAHGYNVSEVASQLGITSHTITYHLTNAQKKLAARNKTQAVAVAIQNGWLRDD